MKKVIIDVRDLKFVLDTFEENIEKAESTLRTLSDQMSYTSAELNTWKEATRLLESRLEYLVNKGIYVKIHESHDK